MDKAEEVLGPFLQEPDGQLLLSLLNSLKEVKKGIFGSVLAPDWEDIVNQFKEDLELAHSCCGLPITPKLHVIHRHVEQAVMQTGGHWAGSMRKLLRPCIRSSARCGRST